MPDRRNMSKISPEIVLRPFCNSLVRVLKMLRAQEPAPNSLPPISCAQSRTSRTAHSSLSPLPHPSSLSSCHSEWLDNLLHACPPAGEKGLVRFDILLIRGGGAATASPDSYQEQVGSAEIVAVRAVRLRNECGLKPLMPRTHREASELSEHEERIQGIFDVGDRLPYRPSWPLEGS